MPIRGNRHSRGACDEVFAITEDPPVDWLPPPVRLVCKHISDILQMDEVHLAHFFEVVVDSLEYN